MVKGKIVEVYPLANVEGVSLLGNSGAFEVLVEGDKLIYSKLGGAGHLSEEKIPQLLGDLKAVIEAPHKE